MLKICTKCKVEKDISEYHRDNVNSGYQPICKKCRLKLYYLPNKKKWNERSRQWRLNNKERYNYTKELYRKNNPDRVKQWKENARKRAAEK